MMSQRSGAWQDWEPALRGACQAGESASDTNRSM